MKNICLIPARGGSKRLPRKNIKLFFGKPLIAWSIEVAKSSQIFDEVYVSTDDKEIADIAIAYGANVPFLRPENLSNDYAIDKDVIDHFIKWMFENKIHSELLCYLYATAPFVTNEILLGLQKVLLENNASLAQTVTKYDYPALKALKKNRDGTLSYMWEDYAKKRTQDLPELIHDAGQCYFFNLEKYGKEKKIVGLDVPRLYCQDIDTLEDFKNAEKLFSLFFKDKKY